MVACSTNINDSIEVSSLTRRSQYGTNATFKGCNLLGYSIIGRVCQTSIEIKTPPTKTKYTEGEKFYPEGMVVTLTDENGKKVYVTEEKKAIVTKFGADENDTGSPE